MDMGGMTALQVRHALLGEIAHQVIMRGCLRSDNANACHVYVMEADLANYLLNNIFKGSKQLPIDGTKRPERAPVLTPVQRKKATMIRKNFPLYQETPTELLMKGLTGSCLWSWTFLSLAICSTAFFFCSVKRWRAVCDLLWRLLWRIVNPVKLVTILLI